MCFIVIDSRKFPHFVEHKCQIIIYIIDIAMQQQYKVGAAANCILWTEQWTLARVNYEFIELIYIHTYICTTTTTKDRLENIK